MQAIIYTISPFDAEIGGTIKFSWNGNQVFKNRCVIRDNDTNTIVYDHTIDSFKLEHPIDLSIATLVNGKKYNAIITVFDKDGVESDPQSLGSVFLCLKTPVFKFSNVINGQVISSSTYEFTLDYSQENGELLDSWSITVYTKSLTTQVSSGVKYDTSDLSYVASGFSNNTEYVVRGEGQTVNGMKVDTGNVSITISYSSANVFSMLDPVNVADVGAIHLRSNIVSSEGHLVNAPVYIDGEYLDVRNDMITFSEGFLFEGNFSYIQVFYGMKPNQEFLYLHDDSGRFLGVVTYRISQATENGEIVMKSLFELKFVNNGIESFFYSNKLPLLGETDKVQILIMRQNGLWEIKTEVAD